MDHILPVPDTRKHIVVSTNDSLYVACSSVQGYRCYMEDEHTILLGTPIDRNCSFCAIFDGHGGSRVAKLAKHSLHTKVLSSSNYGAGKIKQALQEGFMSLDLEMKQDRTLTDGSTALVVLIKDMKLYCANAGDSRALAYVGGRSLALSKDHKPTSPEEFFRIISAGLAVEDGRIEGDLAVSRGFGDFMYKRVPGIPPSLQAVSCLPDVRVENITPNWKFVLLASDGVFDVLSTERVGLYVIQRIYQGLRPEVIIKRLLNYCLSTFKYKPSTDFRGSDNMTVVLIVFKNHVSDVYREILAKPPASRYNGPCFQLSLVSTTKAGTSGVSTMTSSQEKGGSSK